MELSETTIFGIVIFLYFSLAGSQSAKLLCYKGSFSDYNEVPLKSPESLITSSTPCLNVSACTLIFVFGYGGNRTGPAVSMLIPTFLNQTDCNVMLLDWEDEAGGGLFGPLLGYPLHAVPNTETVGKLFGKALVKLVKAGLNIRGIHVVGHSLGAHLAGYAGRTMNETGLGLPWITALDPVRLAFHPPVLTRPLDSSCAQFVDCVHCDPGGYGINVSLGHADFWPNYGQFVDGNRKQPGCNSSVSTSDLAVNGNFCNHQRCVELYNASFAEPLLLEGAAADSYYTWLDANDKSDMVTNYIGPKVDKTKKYDFYLETYDVYPFGEGPSGI